jgi:hypothetical protein
LVVTVAIVTRIKAGIKAEEEPVRKETSVMEVVVVKAVVEA